MSERIVAIDPNLRGEFQKIVGEKFRDWHSKEWTLVYPSFDTFRQTVANATFLAYLEYFLEAAGETGEINTSQLETTLRGRLGEYFSPDKFENAVHFFEAGDWKYL